MDFFDMPMESTAFVPSLDFDPFAATDTFADPMPPSGETFSENTANQSLLDFFSDLQSSQATSQPIKLDFDPFGDLSDPHIDSSCADNTIQDTDYSLLPGNIINQQAELAEASSVFADHVENDSLSQTGDDETQGVQAEAEEAAKAQAEAEEAARAQAEAEEAARAQAEAEEAARAQAEAEEAARAQAEAEEAARAQAEAEEAARAQAEAEEAARVQAEVEEAARVQAEAEEAARAQAEAEEAARAQAEVEEAARVQAEAEEAARVQAEAEEAARVQAEAEEEIEKLSQPPRAVRSISSNGKCYAEVSLDDADDVKNPSAAEAVSSPLHHRRLEVEEDGADDDAMLLNSGNTSEGRMKDAVECTCCSIM